jgi:hypothetical protein
MYMLFRGVPCAFFGSIQFIISMPSAAGAMSYAYTGGSAVPHDLSALSIAPSPALGSMMLAYADGSTRETSLAAISGGV